ncbi:hypothetical protein KKG56_01705, partial [bacterium]|nr:hypothetical protein [bacterium]
MGIIMNILMGMFGFMPRREGEEGIMMRVQQSWLCFLSAKAVFAGMIRRVVHTGAGFLAGIMGRMSRAVSFLRASFWTEPVLANAERTSPVPTAATTFEGMPRYGQTHRSAPTAATPLKRGLHLPSAGRGIALSLCSRLQASSSMLRVLYSNLCAPCSMLRALYSRFQAPCSILRVLCSKLHAPSSILRALCSKLHASSSNLHALCSRLQSPCFVFRGSVSKLQSPSFVGLWGMKGCQAAGLAVSLAVLFCMTIGVAAPEAATLTTSFDGERATVAGGSDFRLRWNEAWGGSIDQLYLNGDFANDRKAVKSWDNKGVVVVGVGQTTTEICNSVGSYNTGSLTMLENTPTRARIRQEVKFGSEPATLVREWTIYPTGKAYYHNCINVTSTITTTDTLFVQLNGQKQGFFNKAKAKTDCSYLMLEDNKDKDMVDIYYGINREWLEMNDAWDGGSIQAIIKKQSSGNLTPGTYQVSHLWEFGMDNLSQNEQWQSGKPIYDHAMDYRNPSTASTVSIGSRKQDASGDDDYDGFNESQGCYEFNAYHNRLKFELNGSTCIRYKPVFRIHGYTIDVLPCIKIGTRTLTVGTDYNVSMEGDDVVIIQYLGDINSTVTIDINCVDPYVGVIGTAPSYLCEDEINDIFKVTIANTVPSQAGIGTVTWERVDVRFNDMNGNPIANLNGFCTNIWAYYDNGNGYFDGGDIEVGSGTRSGATSTISMATTSTYAQIPEGATQTYFIALAMNPLVPGGTHSRTLVGKVDANGTQSTYNSGLENIIFRNADFGAAVITPIGSEIVFSIGSYTVFVPKNPTVKLSNTAPSVMKDGSIDDVLKMCIYHNSSPGSLDLRFDDLDVRLLGSGTPMGSTTAQAIFEAICVYSDNASGTNTGVFGSGDTLVGSITGTGINPDVDGKATIILPGGITIPGAGGGGSITCFVVAKLKNTASGVTSNKNFQFRINAKAGDVRVKDAYFGTVIENRDDSDGTKTSGVTNPVPIDPIVNVVDAAPVSISNGSERALLGVSVANQGTSGAGGLELANYLKVKFTDGTATLSTADADALFEYIGFWRDNGDGSFGESDSLVGTYAVSLDSSGVQLLSFVDNGATITTNAATTTNYFLTVKLTSNASLQGTKTFVSAIDGDVDVTVVDRTNNVSLPNNITSPVLSTKSTAVPASPQVAVDNVAGATMAEGSKGALLKVKVTHIGLSGIIELGTLTVKMTTDGTATLGTDAAKLLFNNIYVYLDNGDGVYGTAADTTAVATITNSNISIDANGSMTMVFTDDDASVQIAALGSRTYFLVMDIAGTASAVAARTFAAAIHEQQYLKIRDASTNVPIELISGETKTTTVVTIVPPNPTVIVTDVSPSTHKMSEGQTEDIMRLQITHIGAIGSNNIEFATMTMTLKSAAGATLTQSQAGNLIGTISVYYSTNANFDAGDVLVGSTINITGTPSIAFVDGSSTVQILPGSSTNYFVVAQIKSSGAAAATPNTFAIMIDGDTDVVMEDAANDVDMPVNATTPVTAAAITAQEVPSAPTVTVVDALPPASMADGGIDDLLQVKLAHTGDSKDADIEMASLVFKLTNGASSYAALSTPAAKDLFESLRVYLDNGNNSYDVSDTLVGSISQASINLSGAGTQAISFTDGDPNVQVPQSVGTRTYLFVVKLTPSAHIYGSFSATIDGASLIVQDANTDANISLGSTNIGTASTSKGANADPTVLVYSTAPGTSSVDPVYGRMKNGQTDDLLRICVSHCGQPAGVGIQFATLTVAFTDGAVTLTNTQARELFGTVAVYVDNGDFVFGTADTVVASVTGTSICGTMSINLASNTTTAIPAGGSRDYFLVVSMRGTATIAGTTIFNAIIDGDQCTIRQQDTTATYPIQSTSPVTSSPNTRAAQNNPTITITNTAPSPLTMTDNEKEDLLKLQISHGETGVGLSDIRLSTLTVRWKNAAGDNLSDAAAAALFDGVFVYLDGGDGIYGSSSDTISVGTASPIASVTTISIGSSTNSKIGTNGSRTYFLAVRLKSTASSQVTNNFMATIDGESWVQVVDTKGDVRLAVTSPAGTVSSGGVFAQGVPANAIVTIGSGTLSGNPYKMQDDEESAVLSVAVQHGNTFGNYASIWMEQMQVGFYNHSSGAALTTDQARSLFANVRVYLDSSGGTFSAAADTVVTDVATSSITLSGGTLTITLPKTAATNIATGTTKTYFVVVKLKEDASGTGTRTFRARMDADADVVLKDTNLEEAGTVAITAANAVDSVNITAVPKKPEVIAYNNSPRTYPFARPTMCDNETEDVLRIDIVNHDTVATADGIRFATLTVKWGQQTNSTPLTGAQADAIFTNIWVYLDNGDQGYGAGDTPLTSFAPGSITSGGTMTVAIPLNGTKTIIPAMGTKTYLVVVQAESNAHLQNPYIFTAGARENIDIDILAEKDGVRLDVIGSDTVVTDDGVGILIYQPSGATWTGTTIVSTITITSVTPDGIENRIQDDTEKAILKIQFNHGGTATDSALELAAIKVQFAADGTNPLTNAEANYMIAYCKVYRDTNDNGEFDGGDNAASGECSLSLDSEGIGTITLNDDDADAQVTYAQGTGTFFLTGRLTTHASGGQGSQSGTRTFSISMCSHDIAGDSPTPTGAIFENADTDQILPWDYLSGTITTSQVCKAIPVNPEVTVIDTVPILPEHSYSTISDNEEEDLLKIAVRHISTDDQAGILRFGTISVVFTDGTNTLTPAQAQGLFGTISIYLDNDGDGTFTSSGDSLVAAITGTNISGTPTFGLPDSGSTTITSGQTKNYFLAVQLKSDAHTNTTRSFKALIDADTDAKVSDKRDNIALYLVDKPIVSSTIAYAQEIPNSFGSVTVTSVSPAWLKDTYQDALLAVKVQHVGNNIDAILELSQLRVRFTDGSGNLLTTGDIQNLVSTFYIIRDNNDGTYTESGDTQSIAMVTGQGFTLNNGYGTFTFTDEDTRCWTRYGSTTTYFVVTDLLGTASGMGTRTFRLSVNITPSATGGDVRLEDANTDLEISRGTTANSGTSNPTKAIPINPSGSAVSTSPSTIKNSDQDDLMRLTVTNNGAASAGSITLTNLRVRFTNGGGVPLSSAEAEAIFEDVYLCYSSDGTYELGDPVVGTQSTMSGWLNNGYGTISLAGSTSVNCIIPAGNSSKTYFLVVHQKDTASGAGTHTYAVTIDPDVDLSVYDRDEVPQLTMNSTAPATSSATTAIPIDPTVTVSDTATLTTTIKDGTIDDVLRLEITNNGMASAGAIEFATLTVYFENDDTIGDAIGTLSVYYDDGDGYYDAGDTVIGSTTNLSTNVIMSWTPDASSQIASASTRNYFLVVSIKPTASNGSCDQFRATVNPADVGVRDAVFDIPLSLDATSTGATSTQQFVIAVEPTITATNSVGSSTIKDGADDDLLKIEVKNNGVSGAGGVELGTITVRFTSLTDADSQALFGSVSVYYSSDDNIYGAGDTLVGQTTSIASVTTIAVTDVIPANGTRTYFVVARLTTTASGVTNRKFAATINAATSTTGDIKIRDESTNIPLTMASAPGSVTSGTITPIPVNPTLTITDIAAKNDSRYGGDAINDPLTAPARATEGHRVQVLKFELTNNGESGAGAIEFATMTVKWFGTDSEVLSQDHARELFGTISVFRDDDGNGTYTAATDTTWIKQITKDSIVIDNGTMTIGFTDGDANARAASNTTVSYFLVIDLAGTASVPATNTFMARVDPVDCVVEDVADDIVLNLVPTTATTSTQILIMGIPASPTMTVGTLPIEAIRDTRLNAILKVILYHVGDVKDSSIELANLRVKFVDASGATMTASKAVALFDSMSVYYDRQDEGVKGVFDADNDTLLGNVTNFGSMTDGEMVFIFGDGSRYTRVAPMGAISTDFYNKPNIGSATYFLVFKLKPDASGTSNKQFRAIIDVGSSSNKVRVEDANTDELVGLNQDSQSGTSTLITPIPVDPLITATSKSELVPTFPGIMDLWVDDIMSVKAEHLGTSGAGSGWFATMTVRWQDGAGGSLGSSAMTALFNSVRVFWDEGQDGYGVGTDTCIATITTFGSVTDNGTMTIDMPKGTETRLWPAGSADGPATKTYTLVVDMKNNASSQNPESFVVTISESGANGSPTGVLYKEWETAEDMFMSGTDSVTAATLTAIAIEPLVEVFDTATATTTMKDGGMRDDLMRLRITNRGTSTAGGIEFGTLTVKWTHDQSGSQPIATQTLKQLFKKVFVYLDGGIADTYESGTDTVCVGSVSSASITITSGGTMTLVMNIGADTTIGSNSSKTYFLVVELNTDTTGTSNKTFVARIGTGSVSIRDESSDLGLNLYSSSTTCGSSTMITAIPVDPRVVVMNTAGVSPFQQRDGSREDLLRIDVANLGTSSAGYIELATVTVKFTSNGTIILSTATAQALFQNIIIVKDANANSAYDSGIDIPVGTVSSASINLDGSGRQVINLPESGTITQVSAAATQTYFVVIELKQDASANTTKHYVAEVVPADVRVEDAPHDIALSLTGDSIGSQSTIYTVAVPVNPAVSVTNIAPIQIRDTNRDSLLKVDIGHQGIAGAGAIELAELRFKLMATGSTTTLTTVQAQALFGTWSLFVDGTTTLVYSTTTISLTDGVGTMTIEDGIAAAAISGAATRTYYLAFTMKDDASGTFTKQWRAVIDGACGLIIQDRAEDINLSYSIAPGTSSMVTAVPVDPTVVVSDTVGSFTLQSPARMRDGLDIDDVLSIKITNNGTPTTAGRVEFGTLTIWLGSDTTTALTQAQARDIFGSISVILDDGDGGYGTATDTVVMASAAGSGITLTGGVGTLTMNITQGTNALIAAGNGTRTYFVVVQLKPTASGTQTRTFVARVGTASVGVRDEASDLSLPLRWDSSGSQSTQGLAIPVDPSVMVVDTVERPWLKDNMDEDLLRIQVQNNGAAGARGVELRQMLVQFITTRSGATTTLTTADARALFGTIAVYCETSENAAYTTGSDTLVSSMIGSGITLGADTGVATFTFTNDNANMIISPASSKYYYVVITTMENASDYATRSFRTIIGTPAYVTVKDAERENVTLNLGTQTTGTVTSSNIVIVLPKDPGVMAADTAPVTPSTMNEGEINDLMSLDITHNGSSTANAIEFGSVTLKWKKNSSATLTTLQIQALFDFVWICRDGTSTGIPGQWDTSDIKIGTWSNGSLSLTSAGTMCLSLGTNNTGAMMSGSSTTKFFIVVQVKPNASQAQVTSFCVAVGEDSSSIYGTNTDICVADESSDWALEVATNFSKQSNVVSVFNTPGPVNFILPHPNEVVSGTKTVEITCPDTIDSVQFWVMRSGTDTYWNLAGTVGTRTTDPSRGDCFKATWTTTAPVFTDDSYTVWVEIFDQNGSSQGIKTVDVILDNTPPTIKITSPTSVWARAGNVLAIGYDYKDAHPAALTLEVYNSGGVIGQSVISSLAGDSGGTISATSTICLLTSATQGTYSVRVTITDTLGNAVGTNTQADCVLVDNTAPTFDIGSPTGGAIVSGTVSVLFNGTDSMSGIVGTPSISIDNGAYVLVGSWSTASGQGTYTWVTTGLTEGAHTLKIKGTDTAGQVGYSELRAVNVGNEQQAFVALITPETGEHITGTVAVKAAVVGVSTVVFGYGTTSWTNIGTVTAANEWTCQWNTSVLNGTYSVRAVGYNAAGNAACTNTNTNIEVDNTQPIGAVSIAALVSGVATITYTSSELDIRQVIFSYGTATGTYTIGVGTSSIVWNTKGLPDGSYTISAVAEDEVGLIYGTTAGTKVDNTAPSISITSPAAGTVLKGICDIAFGVTDAVSGLDGTPTVSIDGAAFGT